MTFFSLNSFRVNKSLVKNVSQTKSLLEEARYYSISGKSDSTYGIKLLSGSIIEFTGSSYVSTSTTNKTLAFTDAIIQNISFSNGASEFMFNKSNGTVSATGTFQLKMTNDATKISTFTVNSSGLISAQ